MLSNHLDQQFLNTINFFATHPAFEFTIEDIKINKEVLTIFYEVGQHLLQLYPNKQISISFENDDYCYEIILENDDNYFYFVVENFEQEDEENDDSDNSEDIFYFVKVKKDNTLHYFSNFEEFKEILTKIGI